MSGQERNSERRNPHIDRLPISPPPKIEILGITTVPDGDRQIASSATVFAGESARTCYSGRGICRPADYLDPRHQPVTDQVIESTRKAGHLTPRQHFEIVFGLSNVSRQLIWAFLHTHPFYNSEQVSQRYVAVKEGGFFIPPLKGRALELYMGNAREQMHAYHQLKGILEPIVAGEYLRVFPRRATEKWQKKNESIFEKKAQEVARYVLGVDTFSYLYYTVNALTLMRLFRTCSLTDVPLEAKLVVYEMVNKVAGYDPNFLKELDDDPYPLEETPEFLALTSLRLAIDYRAAASFNTEFDRELAGLSSRLIDWSTNAPHTLAEAVRAVLGIETERLSDEKAIELVLDPANNRTLGDVLNLTTLNKVTQALHAVSYTFAKRISHTADSQDQRHRMVPAARPIISTHYSGEPDFITPALIRQSPDALSVYQAIMEKTFATINHLLEMGIPPEFALYRLPNAFPVRFVESGSLLFLHHKYRMRLCYNAQEEIWQASTQEAQQISRIHPQIGRWLLAPCGLRQSAHTTPFCPEGERYCGQHPWGKTSAEYPSRII